jgi:hypothetical protein
MSIVKATRANYAALQHRDDGIRKALNVRLETKAGEVHRWVFWVIADSDAKRKREITRALRRMMAMYPFEWKSVAASFDKCFPA